MNLPITDLKNHQIKFNKNKYYTSKTINKLWKKGYVIFSEANWENAAYVARYSMKKQIGINKKFLNQNGYTEEFVRMSKKPAIGQEWYEKNKNQMWKYDEIHIANKTGTITAKPPRYFDKKLEIENNNLLIRIKKKRTEFAIQKLLARPKNEKEWEYLDRKKELFYAKIKGKIKRRDNE